MFVSHHTLKWTRTCRSHGRHPHAHTAHFLLNRHTPARPGSTRPTSSAGHGACEHALRLEHDLGNGPPHGRVRQTSALVGHMGQVVGPRAGACHTLVPSDPHQQVHGVLADGMCTNRRRHEERTRPMPRIPGNTGRSRPPARSRSATLRHTNPRSRAFARRDSNAAIQAKQDPTIEHARLNTKPRGFIHFFQSHTESNRTGPYTPKCEEPITTPSGATLLMRD